MIKVYLRLGLRAPLALLIAFVTSFTLAFVPDTAHAQWPPFKFDLEPSFAEGQITYQIEFSSRVDWAMTDIAFKIPLPQGTRFLKAGALPNTRVDFDGTNVTFFTANFNQKSIKDAFFVVEVVDPSIADYTTHAWISWKGDQAGNYRTEDVLFDPTKKPLDWQKPKSRLQLEAGATVTDSVITYKFYPTNVGRLRMWDLKVNVPIPEGTTFLSAEAPAPFITSFDGQEASFFTIELAQDVEAGPLSFKVSTEGNTAPFVVTHAWATWKNVGKRVGKDILAQEDFRTGDIIVQPHANQQVVSDAAGDVPFSNYDLTSIALQEDASGLKVIFHAAGELGPVGEPLEYLFYIDRDCRVDTGLERNGRGVEYRMRYRHNRDRVDIHFRDETEQTWLRWRSPEEVNREVVGKLVAVWLPGDSLEIGRQFCWVGEAKNRSDEFSPNPPTERVPGGNSPRLTQYDVAP